MKFSTVFSVAALVTGIVAEPVKRDISTITGVFSKISSQVDTLNSDIAAYSGDGAKVEADSNALLATIKSGTAQVQGTSPLTSSEALQLTSPVKQLTAKITTSVNGLTSIKSQIISDGYGQTVYKALVAQKAAADGLASATVSKVPKSLQSIAQQLSAGISNELEKGIAAFKGAPGGSPSSSSMSSTMMSSTTKMMSSTMSSPSGYSTTSMPSPTYSTMTSSMPSGTGGYTPTPTPTGSPIPTNAAALKAVSGAVGGVAILAAILGL